MTDIFPESVKHIKPKIHKQSTKGKEKILKTSRKKHIALKSDLHASQYQQWKPEDSGMISIVN